MRGPGADFHVVRLQQRTTLLAPIILEIQRQLLERQHGEQDRRKALILLDARGATKRHREFGAECRAFGAPVHTARRSAQPVAERRLK
jgi:hypothetical protein